MSAPDAPTDPSVLKAGRSLCHQKRDEYFQCVEKSGVSQNSGPAVPLLCKEQRKAFEDCCKDSWVKHFDTLNTKQQQYAKIMRK